ncbi:hypothetical protein FIU86_04420 [Roseovarius sp. THAF9]|uniref:hypothetical protein n=1 Tax=Roseovarius sp. THAF9 TaxID=2587847 RepID=UPI001268062B|nr:hypothetical protein [Roseovarius sp. THAF9]QFT92076.1 hypothetical protein FIU86_04420 [Roseovarius sp. THAF9]
MRKILNDRNGAGATEYMMVAGLVAALAAPLAASFGGATGDALSASGGILASSVAYAQESSDVGQTGASQTPPTEYQPLNPGHNWPTAGTDVGRFSRTYAMVYFGGSTPDAAIWLPRDQGYIPGRHDAPDQPGFPNLSDTPDELGFNPFAQSGFHVAESAPRADNLCAFIDRENFRQAPGVDPSEVEISYTTRTIAHSDGFDTNALLFEYTGNPGTAGYAGMLGAESPVEVFEAITCSRPALPSDDPITGQRPN